MMFGDVDKFQDRTYFDEHRYGNIYYEGRSHGMEIFAMVDADAYDFTLYDAHVTDPQAYLDYIERVATNWNADAAVSADDHIVMLSTCADTATNGRYVVFGVLRDEVYEDTFVEEAPAVVSRTLTIPGTQSEVPVMYLVLALILVALILIVALIIAHVHKKRQQRRARREARELSRDERNRRRYGE